jgi:hypothetical protein
MCPTPFASAVPAGSFAPPTDEQERYLSVTNCVAWSCQYRAGNIRYSIGYFPQNYWGICPDASTTA